MTELFELTTSECESLLRAGIVGRVAVSTPDGPLIIPLNYSVSDDAIMVRTTPDSMLGTHAQDAVFAFEVDHFDYPNGRGWSVLARGRCELINDWDELERTEEVSAPRPWADGPRPVVLRLAWDELSGRRLGRGWDPLKQMPVRRMSPIPPPGPDRWPSAMA